MDFGGGLLSALDKFSTLVYIVFMRVPRIYLETTLFNFYLDKDRDAHADTVTLFNEVASGKYEAFTSTYVTDELEKAPEEKRNKMLSLITEYNIAVWLQVMKLFTLQIFTLKRE